MRPLILKTGSAIPELIGRRGDFEHYFAKALGLSERQYDVLDARFALRLPQPAGVDWDWSWRLICAVRAPSRRPPGRRLKS